LRFLAALLIPISFAACANVTKIEFSRSGGQLPGRTVRGSAQLWGGSGRVTAANGYVRDLGAGEVSELRRALVEPAPPGAPSAPVPDAYVYSVRIERGHKVQTISLSDASRSPLVPWLQKETAAIGRFSPEPATH
jgi:hypothetical protein